ncbi:sensor protein KdpD [Oerskovia enterophila]|uniref:histidine kinase n=1 Tax=Oerskovia enterophila TaxID=43678 RepID=A0ABX2Y627_9CELL|nr:sensor protein KdpD [Oerskovia enterophila]
MGRPDPGASPGGEGQVGRGARGPDGAARRPGLLTVYLGAAPGVGKTYAMLGEAHRRRSRGTDVVVGLVETHGRAATITQIGDLEVVPRRVVSHRDVELTELDVEAVLARDPQVVLVDELAHTNAPGSRHRKRWQDVQDLLAAGIDVVTTVNVQHLESLTADVEAITGVRQRETVPDQVVRDADQIQLVDLSPQALRRRLAHGNVYRAEQIDASLSSYFRTGNLTALRELALLWLADRVDDALTRYRADHAISGTWPARERIVVAVTGGPEGETLLRRGARIAQRAAGSELVAVHVLATDGLPSAPPAAIAASRELVESLGGTFHTVVGEDVASAIVDFAQGVNATMIVVGVSRHSRWREALLGSSSAEIARLAGTIDVHLVTHEKARAGRLLRGRWSALSRPRRTAGWALAFVVPAVLTGIFWLLRDVVSLSTELMLFLAGSVAVALVGGLWPAVAAAVVSFLCLNWFFTPPTGFLTVQDPENLLALLVFVLVAAAVASVVDLAARRTAQAYRARAEASTLAALSRSVLSGEDTAQAIVTRLAETFGLSRVELETRAGERGPWRTVASTGRVEGDVRLPEGDGVFAEGDRTPAEGDGRTGARSAVGHLDDAERTELRVDDSHRLSLWGRALPASDRQVLEAFAAQAGLVLEYRRLREQAAQAAVLEEADATRTALLAAVSHDLRTPLASIRTAVDGLASPDVHLDAEDTDALTRTIQDSTGRLEKLIDNLLDLSRLQTGSVRPVLRAASVDEIVPLAIEPYGPGVVRLDVPDDLPLVRTDPGLLERAVANLTSNAVRHSPPGEPVRITASAGPREIELRIVDTGRGLSDESKIRMFEPFQRLGDTTGEGLGLGLAVADGLARAVGASITPEDTPGGGLTMVVTVPREAREDDDVSTDGTGRHRGVGTGTADGGTRDTSSTSETGEVRG